MQQERPERVPLRHRQLGDVEYEQCAGAVRRPQRRRLQPRHVHIRRLRRQLAPQRNVVDSAHCDDGGGAHVARDRAVRRAAADRVHLSARRRPRRALYVLRPEWRQDLQPPLQIRLQDVHVSPENK